MFTITMTLDMTQEKGEHGILSFEYHMKPKDYINEIKTDGKYTNIAWDNIDIDKKYRIAFSIFNTAADKVIELLPQLSNQY